MGARFFVAFIKFYDPIIATITVAVNPFSHRFVSSLYCTKLEVIFMALIKCVECGKEISDKAAFCPSCGCPIEMEVRNASITFWWVGKKGDSLRKTTVYIDSEEVATMKCGNQVTVLVNGSTHQVDMYQGKHHLISEKVIIDSEGETFAYKEVYGLTHAKLERISNEELKRKPRCPTCGSDKVKKISTSKKIFAFGMIGFASSSVGKTFECKSCGYKW